MKKQNLTYLICIRRFTRQGSSIHSPAKSQGCAVVVPNPNTMLREAVKLLMYDIVFLVFNFACYFSNVKEFPLWAACFWCLSFVIYSFLLKWPGIRACIALDIYLNSNSHLTAKEKYAEYFCITVVVIWYGMIFLSLYFMIDVTINIINNVSL